MSIQSKFFKLNPNILVEYIYNNENIYAENYSIVTDLNTTEKLFVPTATLSKSNLSTNLLLIDPVINRFTTYSPDFNFYQKQDYFTAPLPHDTIKIYLPVGFNFLDNGYTGLHLKTYSLNFNNKKNVLFSSYFFDDQDTKRQGEISLGASFLYDEKQWGEYIQFDLPSPYYVSKERITNSTQNYPTPYTINANLDVLGTNENTPIIFDFSFIISTTTTFGVKYYNLGDLFRTSISKIPEYQNLAVQINESTNGDYFEIYGTYGNSNENLDDFVDELRAKGQQIKIQYIVSLYEENILQRTQTFEVEENFSQKVFYRPIIMFSNTTAAINVEMKVTDLVNMSSFSRLASIGLTQNIFKYGKNLTRIELTNAYKPKLYNTKPSTVTMQGGLNASAVIDVTKVNYPLLVNNFKVLIGSNNLTSITDYKPTGVLQIYFTPFDNVIKLYIAKEITADNTIEPYNLANLLVNAELTMIFKSDDQFLEKSVFQETGDNDLTNGVVVFKVTQPDIVTLKNIQKNNNNFFLTIKAKNTNVRTQLYSGKFIMYEDLKFYDTTTITQNSIAAVPTVSNNISATPTIIEGSLLGQNVSTVAYDPISYRNLMVYLKLTSDPLIFESYLETIGLKNNIYIKYNFSYFVLAVPAAIITEIKNNSSVEKVVELTFELGKNKVPNLSPRDRRIAELENQIRNQPDWLDAVKQGAVKDNISLFDAIHLNAVWQYDFEQAEAAKRNIQNDDVNTNLQTQKKNTSRPGAGGTQTGGSGSVGGRPGASIVDSNPYPTEPLKYIKVAADVFAKTTPGGSTNTTKLKVGKQYQLLSQSQQVQEVYWYYINTGTPEGNTVYGWIAETDVAEII